MQSARPWTTSRWHITNRWVPKTHHTQSYTALKTIYIDLYMDCYGVVDSSLLDPTGVATNNYRVSRSRTVFHHGQFFLWSPTCFIRCWNTRGVLTNIIEYHHKRSNVICFAICRIIGIVDCNWPAIVSFPWKGEFPIPSRRPSSRSLRVSSWREFNNL